MNLYSLRKFAYGVVGAGIGEGVLWLGNTLVNTPVDNWALRFLMQGVGVAFVAGVRRKVLPGLWGAPN